MASIISCPQRDRRTSKIVNHVFSSPTWLAPTGYHPALRSVHSRQHPTNIPPIARSIYIWVSEIPRETLPLKKATAESKKTESCTSPRVVRPEMFMSHVGLGTENDSAGEGQQEFTRQTAFNESECPLKSLPVEGE
jgi:hypothetical protein